MSDSASSRALLSESAFPVLCSVVSAGLGAIYVVLAGRLLGPIEFAELATATSLATLVLFLAGPIETGICKFAATFHAHGEEGKKATLTRNSLRKLGLYLGAALLASTPLIPVLQTQFRFRSWVVPAALAVFVALWFLASVPRGVLRGEHRFVAYGLGQVLESGSRLALGLLFIALGWQASGAMAGYVVGIFCSTALGIWQLRRLWRVQREVIDVRHLYASSWPSFCSYFYFLFVVSADMLLAKRFLPEREAGVYAACSTIVRLLGIGMNPVLQVVFSRVTGLHARDADVRGPVWGIGSLLLGGLLLSLPMIWLAQEHVLTLLFGPKFAAEESPLWPLWLMSCLSLLEQFIMFVLLATDRLTRPWLLFLPCLVQVAATLFFHETGRQIAWCALLAVGVGLLPLAISLAGLMRKEAGRLRG